MLKYERAPLRLRVRAFRRSFSEPPPRQLRLSVDGETVRVVGVAPPRALRGLLAGADPSGYRDRTDDV